MSCLATVESKYAAVEHYRRFLKFLRDDIQDTPMDETVALADHPKADRPICSHHVGTNEPCGRQVLFGQACSPLLEMRVWTPDLN
jgi:hypothetical protein